MTHMTLEAKIEALLFWKNESVNLSWLSKALEKPKDEIEKSLEKLEENLVGRGVVLQRNGEEVALKTTPAASSLIDKFSKEEMVRELTPSALETLSIIVYRGPLPKKEIDYIRGVNSGFILRSLLIRGLIQKEETNYKPTLDLLSLLGISSLPELEEYETVRKEIERFKQQDVEDQNKQ